MKKYNAYIFLFIIFGLQIASMYYVANNNLLSKLSFSNYNYDDIGFVSSVIYSVMYVVCFAYIIAGLNFLGNSNLIVKFFIVFLFYASIMSILYIYDTKTLIKALIFPELPLSIFLSYYILGRSNPQLASLIAKLQIVLVAENILLVSWIYDMKNLIRDVDISIDFAFYSYFSLPLILLIDKKIVRAIAIVTIGFIVFFSAKRSGIVGFIGGTYIYFLVKNIFIERKNRGFYIILTPILMGATIAGLIYMNIRSGGFLFYRFSQISETGGNGRIDIWIETLKGILNASPIQQIFGHGAYAISYIWEGNPLAGGTHNDYIGAFFSYGIIGLFLSVSILFLFVKNFFAMLKVRFKYVAIFAMAICFFIVATNVSIVYYNMEHNLYIFSFLGFVIGTFDSERTSGINVAREL